MPTSWVIPAFFVWGDTGETPPAYVRCEAPQQGQPMVYFFLRHFFVYPQLIIFGITNTSYMTQENHPLIGKRIKLIEMKDPFPVEPGSEGTITSVDGMGQIWVHWDNGRGLAVIPETDEYEILV